MPDLANILPDFARDRQMVLRDLSEKQAQMFDKWVEEQRQHDIESVNKIIANANDATPSVLKTDALPPMSDVAEMQKQLERDGIAQTISPSLESRIKSAKEAGTMKN